MSESSDLEVLTFPVPPLGCNCAILSHKPTRESIVVDPGGDAQRITGLLKERGYTVKWIIHTHAHFDHCLGTHDVAENCRSEGNTDFHVGMHAGDLPLYDSLPAQCRMFRIPAPTGAIEPINHMLQDEEELKFGDYKLQVLHTPGHTPGSCSFNLPDYGLLFTGDTLFAGGIGRTDLPGGSYDTIIHSIKNRLLVLDEGTTVIPGHGDMTRIYEEKHHNPFL